MFLTRGLKASGKIHFVGRVRGISKANQPCQDDGQGNANTNVEIDVSKDASKGHIPLPGPLTSSLSLGAFFNHTESVDRGMHKQYRSQN
jgi:hypothetical protein